MFVGAEMLALKYSFSGFESYDDNYGLFSTELRPFVQLLWCEQ